MWSYDEPMYDEPVYEEVDMLTILTHNPAISTAMQLLTPEHRAAVRDVFQNKVSFLFGCETDAVHSYTHAQLAKDLCPRITCKPAELLNYWLRTEGVEQVQVRVDCTPVCL